MSFLNPVNEPVLRFSSTDADAPQINYNARTAGDVKTVLKACLVTGYGAKASAGWSVVNEVDHVAEFVSPSAAMADYRLGIDDSAATKTDWYYQYQNVRTNPSYSNPSKSFSSAVKTSAENGWQMLVTERGIVFIELIQHSVVNKLSARITYWGQVKSAIPIVTGRNICFFNIGHSAGIAVPPQFYGSKSQVHTQLEAHTSAAIIATVGSAQSKDSYVLDTSNVDLVSSIYLANDDSALLIGELPPMMPKIVNNTSDIYGVSEFALGDRNVLSVTSGFASTIPSANAVSRNFLIRTDYWEY